MEGVGFSMLESKVRQQHLEPAQTARVQPDIGPNVSPPTDVSMTRVLALTSWKTQYSPAGKRTAAGLNRSTFFPLQDTQGHVHHVFFVSFSQQKTASITQNASAAVAVIDTP